MAPADSDRSIQKVKHKTIAVSMFALLGVLAAFGFWPHRLSVEIPFDYYAGSVAMPAGTYLIEGHTENRAILLVRNRRGSAHAIVATRPEGIVAGDRSELLFHRYGNTYFLARITDGTSGAVRRLPVSDKEKEMAAVTAAKPELYALVVNGPPS